MEKMKKQSLPLIAGAGGGGSLQSVVIDLQNHIQIHQHECRICLEPTGSDFIAPCNCTGTSKFVHRTCLDSWRAEKEGFAFAHCTTCRAPYYLTAHDPRKWRTFKFRFFVTRDILLVFLAVVLVICALTYLVYVIDAHCNFWLQHTQNFLGGTIFYYICGTVLFLAVLGLCGCCHCCLKSSGDRAGESRYDGMQGTDTMMYVGCWNGDCVDPTSCCDGSSSSNDSGVAAACIFFLVVVVVLAVFGIFYGMVVASMVGRRIWQRHYHILSKRIILTKEYVVEDVDVAKARLGGNTVPPGLPAEHVQRLESLGLLSPSSTNTSTATSSGSSYKTAPGSVYMKYDELS